MNTQSTRRLRDRIGFRVPVIVQSLVLILSVAMAMVAVMGTEIAFKFSGFWLVCLFVPTCLVAVSPLVNVLARLHSSASYFITPVVYSTLGSVFYLFGEMI